MKRIISVVLAILILFCINTAEMVSYAEDSDVSYVSELMACLNIDFKVSEGVTRSQFIYDIMQLINSANTGGSSADTFTDISPDDYFYGAVSSAVSLGIISQGTKFRPDDPVTVAEACKIMVSALGMGFEAQARGGYPTGYFAVAHSCGLVGQASGNSISVAQMYDIAIRFLDAGPYVIDAVGSNSGDVSYISDKTVLEYYHNVVRIEGVVTANEHTGMYLGSAAVAEGYASVDDVAYKTAADVTDCIAKNSELYLKKIENKYEIIYAREKDNKSTVIDGEDIFSVSGGKITYVGENGSDKTAVLSAAPAYIYNSKADASFTASDLVGFNGSVELVSNDGDGKIDAVILKEHEIIYVSSVNAYEKTIFDVNGTMKIFDSEDFAVTIIKDGKTSAFDAIAEDDLIKLYSSKDNTVHRMEVVPAQRISGVLTSVNQTEKIITIDNTDYRYEAYFETYYSGAWTIGAQMNFNLTDTGKVFSLSKSSQNETSYGYFIALKRDGTLDTKVKAKVLCEDGSIKALDFASRITIDGNVFKDQDIVTDGTDATVKEGLVRYRLNADGEIKLIDTCENEGVKDKSLSEDNNLTLFKYPSDKYSSIWYIQNTGMFAPYFKVTSDTKIFVVSDDNTLDEKYRYTTQSSNYFQTNRYAAPDNLLAYNVSTVGEAEAIVLKGGTGTQTVVATSATGIVISANKGMDADGDECIVVTLFVKNSYIRLYLADEMLINSLKTDATSTEVPLASGDYVRYSTREDGHITAISKDFDYNAKTVRAAWGNHTNDLIFYYGSVYDKGSNLISLIVENNPKFEPDANDASRRYNLSLPSTLIVYDSASQTAYKGTAADIITYLNNPDCCSKLFMRSYNGTPSEAVIYK